LKINDLQLTINDLQLTIKYMLSKFFQYFYLVFAVLFFYTAYGQYSKGQDYALSIIVGVVALVLFFVRRNIASRK